MSTLQDFGASIACMEHQIFEHVKQALLVTLDWDAPSVSMPRKLSSLQFTIKSFQRHLERILSIEEEGGYMSDAMASKPYCQDRVEHLATDHARFRARVRALVALLAETKEWEELRFNQICGDLRELIADLDRHSEREIELLQEISCTDDGGEG